MGYKLSSIILMDCQIIEKIQVLFHHFIFQLLDENELVTFTGFLIFSVKPKNPIQKYPHINESRFYSIHISINNLISYKRFNFSLGICSLHKLAKHVTRLFLT